MALLDYGYNQYQSREIYKKNKVIKELKLDKASVNKVNLLLKNDLNITEKKGTSDKKYTYEVKLNNIEYPVKKGDTLGVLYLKDGNKVVKEEELITDRSIEKCSVFKQYLRVVRSFITGNVNI